MKHLALPLLAVALAACSTPVASPNGGNTVTQAATTPLSDLNLVRADIPPVLIAAEGIVPFRGWVRKLSGAERYAKEVAAAITAGTIRRAYLKGLGQAAGCAAPAAPRA